GRRVMGRRWIVGAALDRRDGAGLREHRTDLGAYGPKAQQAGRGYGQEEQQAGREGARSRNHAALPAGGEDDPASVASFAGCLRSRARARETIRTCRQLLTPHAASSCEGHGGGRFEDSESRLRWKRHHLEPGRPSLDGPPGRPPSTVPSGWQSLIAGTFPTIGSGCEGWEQLCSANHRLRVPTLAAS